ncbi:MAG: alpha/beta hydrolase [Acidimicrobiales bacterium]|nr:MAG: alpha/beta hydrolase [Acidimicrobiales bacterium]
MTMSAEHVLLVHGAWHGAWCWDRMIEPLGALGLIAHTLDLPGHGESTAPLGDLHGDADAVRGALDGIGAPTLLVGHSYGGMVITDAGTHDAVTELVYVCAFMPAAGMSLLDEGPKQELPPDQTVAPRAPVALTDDGTAIVFGPDGAADVLYNDCDDATRQWAVDKLDHQPTASFDQAPRTLAYETKPSTYIVCTDDRTIHPWNQRRMSARATAVTDLDASHSPFLSMPRELAACIAGR